MSVNIKFALTLLNNQGATNDTANSLVYFKEDKMQPAANEGALSSIRFEGAIYISQRLFARSKQNSGAAARRPPGQHWTAAN